MPNNAVPGIMQDKQGLLWLATSGGVARFDPETKTFITYNEEDGMNNYPVIQQAVIKGMDGRMFIGGPKGVTAINPQDFKPNPNPPVTAITGLHVFEDAFPLPANREEQITLKYNQNELTFDYAGLHFANPSRNRYTYRLEGYDKNWINAGTARRAKYTNLSPGTYTFEVKSSNSDGVWDEKGTSLTIKILPPWWRTTVAYIIYALLGIAFIVLLNRFLRRRLIAKERERTRELELEQAREALQQASLDRVRAEIASMRTAKDLERITPLIWRELKALEVPFIRCGIFIIDEDNAVTHVYLTTPEGKSLGVLNLSFNANKLTTNTVEYWKKKQVYKEHWNKEEFITWTKSMMELGQVQNAETYQGSENPPESLDLHFVPFTQGMLYVGNASPLLSKKIELVKTLAEAFSIAYARYEDFNRVESAFKELDILSKELKVKNEKLEDENLRKALELEEARQLQLSMLPKVLPQLPDLDIDVYMKTATEVGGDYYDFNVASDGTLTVVIGDATGHGMKAGTIVSMIKALFDSNGSRFDMKTFFEQSSATLKGIELGRLMMAFMMIKINGSKLQVSNAGMPPLFIYKKLKQIVEEVEISGMPLGAMKNFPYEIKEIDLSPGDTLLLLSDGFPELKNEKEELFNYKRVLDSFKYIAEEEPKNIISYLKEKGSNWVNNKEPDDDVTFVVIKFK